LSRKIMPGDEELGKKDDDHKPGATVRLPNWPFSGIPLRWRRRRIILAIVGLYLMYLFIHNIPDLGELNFNTNGPHARPIVTPQNDGYQAYDEEPTGPPKGFSVPKNGSPPPRTFNGQIRYYRLAASLHKASNTQGYRPTNRNVLFAISNLKSASTLLPMICETAKWSRNHVHAAFFGREDIPLADILEINGINEESCPAFWHDARPDYMEWSSEQRSESSVGAAMTHIQSYLHPQVAIMDDSLSEDPFFVRGLRTRAKALDIPIIEIPKDRVENFMWITRLDSGSLRNWHHPEVDILIQAPPDSSGGIVRLLKSIKEADYVGLKPPRLTIELPADIDGGVKHYLENFAWPPASMENPLATSQVTLRRRISRQHARQEDSAIRFLELFFPTNTANSHVLLLSPQAQLSPLYFHYIKYVLLEHKYSQFEETDADNLMGVSLELPSVLLDGRTKLTPPETSDMATLRYKRMFPETPSAPFLWQAPNSHAALYFGDKWAELHSFLSNRVTKQHQSSKSAARPKLVSKTLPSWTEYMLELMRARGYSLLYPAMAASETFVTIHHELYHLPEEYRSPSKGDEDNDAYAPSTDLNEPFLVADTPPPLPKNPESTVIPLSRPLHRAMPFEGDLPEIPHLPYLLYNGKMVPPANATIVARDYANRFRETVGGCKIPEGKHRVIEPGNTKDLFCFGDE
ncbi:hypothetical protein CC78DRAFT_407691, partial [Lojkania enalia]